MKRIHGEWEMRRKGKGKRQGEMRRKRMKDRVKK